MPDGQSDEPRIEDWQVVSGILHVPRSVAAGRTHSPPPGPHTTI
ncbi:protein of unassigned function [Methylobacterium oryzae CBMB20]|uniref:Protein of unassigned function n=1 Tax=Methylobacterium oryzae CBMB20 TaxID=693986 RepID=A0A089NRK8_9HYPH|nr:protein of unassigned function [Methylobacterium oryzae CBMB20]